MDGAPETRSHGEDEEDEENEEEEEAYPSFSLGPALLSPGCLKALVTELRSGGFERARRVTGPAARQDSAPGVEGCSQ
ncbi:hypothetical protein AMEX_G1172 [Astyanax mexicanus]|uniref:Uncharacterized protein n=1 Tax=Astyanax mexicanus TaxID=7994 RepID=A0A8T2MH54_ASTMX|nr:hypothetical protein AMEX_G1172 [Astyanax mexicanus]